VIYAATIAAVALASTGMGLYARRQGLTTGGAEARRLGALPVAAVFLLSIPVALWWSADAAKYVWILLVPAQVWSGRALGRRSQTEAT